MPNIAYLVLIVVFVLFFPLPPFGFCTFTLMDFLKKRKEKMLAKKAPQFPCVKILEAKNGFAVCESYYPPTGGPNMYRPGHIKTIKILNTEHLVPGETAHVVPYCYSDTKSSISLKTTRQKISMREFRERSASLLTA